MIAARSGGARAAQQFRALAAALGAGRRGPVDPFPPPSGARAGQVRRVGTG
jgi:hypothetical protein